MLDIRVDGSKIVLSGDLDNTPQARNALSQVIPLLRARHEWIVDADDVSVVPEGVTLWIHFSQENLARVGVSYLPSQLSTILQYDDRYVEVRAAAGAFLG